MPTRRSAAASGAVVDTLGMVIAAVVHSAGIRTVTNQTGSEEARRAAPRLVKILADGIYDGGIAAWAKEIGGWILEVVVRPKDEDEQEKKKFKVLKWRWIVERTFAWLGRYRRLSKDYEGSEASSESWIYIAMIHLMIRRLDPA